MHVHQQQSSIIDQKPTLSPSTQITSSSMGLHSLNPTTQGGRYSPPYQRPHVPVIGGGPGDGGGGEPPGRNGRMPSPLPPPNGNLFGSLDDNLLARAEALADIKNGSPPGSGLVKPDSLYGSSHHSDPMHSQHQPRPAQMSALHGFGPGESMLDQLSGMSMPLTGITPDHGCTSSMSHSHSQMYSPVYSHPMQHHQAVAAAAGMGGQLQTTGAPMGHPHVPGATHHDLDCDPRELEAFAEHFKQRRIKLGVTQADVGNALGKLKIPGVGSLSQSTICRFESLTLSHNNMIALKPVLQAWLEEAEKAAREASQKVDGVYVNNDKKRKRTSIAAPEKRSLEAYFAIQPRPSGEKIAQIAEKLDLKKNVVRVWFCNQRQKQKRMKFSAQGMQAHNPHTPHPHPH